MMPGDFLTIEEVAALMRCEHRTVRRAIHSGELQAAMIGGRYLIRREAVDAWFDSRSQSAAMEPARPRRLSPREDSRGQRSPGSVARLKALEARG